jgi:hypothetical protein
MSQDPTAYRLPFTVPPRPTNVFMLDIETGGLEAPAAILEIAAAEFNPGTGEILRAWHSEIDALDCARCGLHLDAATAGFHLKNGFQGHLRGSTLWRALNQLDMFLHLSQESIEVWAWGLDFETAHLKAAAAAAGCIMPWRYWEGRCARTAWKLAFPTENPPTRPHRAELDVAAQVRDLTRALANLQRKDA